MFYDRFINLFTCLLVMLLLVAGCSDSDTKTTSTADQSAVLATVNGEKISDADVAFALQRTFSNVDLVVDQAMRDKVLDSLIAAKAMRAVMQEQLSEGEKNNINRTVNTYAEELYIKEYLLKNAHPEPVSTSMVEDYYHRNIEEFGGGESKEFELLKTQTKITEQQRDTLLSEVVALKKSTNWKQFSESNANTFGLTFFQSTIRPGLLDPQVEQLVDSLGVGQVSDVAFIGGIPHIARVTNVTSLPAQPLAQVAPQIRKKLAAVQLKKAIKTATEEVRDKVSIKLIKQG